MGPFSFGIVNANLTPQKHQLSLFGSLQGPLGILNLPKSDEPKPTTSPGSMVKDDRTVHDPSMLPKNLLKILLNGIWMEAKNTQDLGWWRRDTLVVVSSAVRTDQGS